MEVRSVFACQRGNLSALLDKAEAFAGSRKFDASKIFQLRLAPDMFSLVRQVQIACDSAKLCCAWLAVVDAPKNEDSETTRVELKARIAGTIAFLKSATTYALLRQHGVELGKADFLGNDLAPSA